MSENRRDSVGSSGTSPKEMKSAHLEVGNDEVHPHDIPEDQHKKMFRKIDIRLMPMLMCL